MKKIVFPPEGDVTLAIDLPPPSPPAFFPLALSDRDRFTRVFAWAESMVKAPEDARPEPYHSHQAMVIRIRNALIDAIRMEISQMLSNYFKIISKKFVDALREMIAKLGLVASHRALLNIIIHDQTECNDKSNSQQDIKIQRLRDIARFRI